jgi:DNA-directed RNA polymerase specialized sigma24 family protein
MNDFGRLLEKEILPLRCYAFALTRNMSPNLRAWLFTIMHNQNVNGVRRRVREGMAVEFDDKWPFPTGQPIRRGLSLRDLDRALARICEQLRQVILLIGLGAFRMRRPQPHSTYRSARSARACHAVARRSAR